MPLGFVVSAETTEVEQKLNPRGSQVHKLNAEMTAHSDRIGIMIIEYRFLFLGLKFSNN